MYAKNHARDTRLYVNAGIRFPLCAANAPLLDTDKSAWPTDTSKPVTCLRCIAILDSRDKKLNWRNVS